MIEQPIDNAAMPDGAKVLLPASIERSVWEYFAAQAEERHVPLIRPSHRNPPARHGNRETWKSMTFPRPLTSGRFG